MNKLLSGILASTMLLSIISTTFAAEPTLISPALVEKSILTEVYTETLFSASVASAYVEVIEGIIANYGDNPNTDYGETGLTIAKLVDLDGDGVSELYVSYVTSADENNWMGMISEENVTSELWAYTSSGVKKIFSTQDQMYSGNVSFSNSTHFLYPQGTTMLFVTSSISAHEFVENTSTYAYQYQNGNLNFADSSSLDMNNATLLLNGFYSGHNSGYSYENCLSQLKTATIPTYPDWASSFIDFAEPTIMPDITPSNYQEASNRGLIAQSLYNMSGNAASVSPSHSFSDVGNFESAIAWCYENNIMSGTGDTTFGTQSNVQREQLCLILKQMATVLEKDTLSGDVSALEGYSDAWSISSWATEAVAWAVANNLMQGNENALNPHGDVTRLEVAIMLKAFSQL